MVTCTGIIIVMQIETNNASLPRNGILAKTNAAMAHTTICADRASLSETATLLPKKR